GWALNGESFQCPLPESLAQALLSHTCCEFLDDLATCRKLARGFSATHLYQQVAEGEVDAPAVRRGVLRVGSLQRGAQCCLRLLRVPDRPKCFPAQRPR